MRKVQCEEAADDCAFHQKSKAAWRRANSDRLEVRRCARSLHQTPVWTSRRRARREKLSIKAGSKSGSKGKAQRCVLLPDWYRNTLSQQLVALQLQLHDCGPEEADVSVPVTDFSRVPVTEFSRELHESDVSMVVQEFPRQASEVESEATAPSAEESSEQCLPSGVRSTSARPEMTDASTQCEPEEIEKETGEPLARSPLGQKMLLRKLKSANIWEEIPYSVGMHFSLFESAERAADCAAKLSVSELEALADRFLGNEIGGVEIVPKSNRPPRLVADRHELEAVLLTRRSPVFRNCLLASARRLLLGSTRRKTALSGRSLLKLADDSAEKWAKLAHTALNFTCRLIQGRALPVAFAAEIIAALADLTPAALLLGLSTMLPAARKSYCYTTRTPGPEAYRRSSSAPVSAPPIVSLGRRSQSSPPVVCCHKTVGTSLRPQDVDSVKISASCCHKLPKLAVPLHSSISFRDKADEICLDIEPSYLPDYWRSAAGGEHSADDLERRARFAEEDYVCMNESLAVI